MLLSCILFVGCNSCSNKEKEEEIKIETQGLNVERINALDMQYMYANYGADYRWLECCIDLKHFMDSDSCTGEVAGIANIFQQIKMIDSNSFIPTVVLIAHTQDTSVIETREGIWVGDDPMNNFNPMKVNYNEAYNRMMQANCPKPHSKHCVLRKEVGPLADVDPIYIFGNPAAQVYVNSTTGAVTTHNPCFPEDSLEKFGRNNKRIGCPLGEWP